MTEVPVKPFFSIVIPTLNEEVCLPFLLQDLLNQSYKDFEVIISDAGSTDSTKKKAVNFKSKFNNLEFVDCGTRNVSQQRNRGAKNSKADWIVFLDADDRIPSYFLQGIKFFIEYKKPKILSTWINADSKNKKDRTIATFINLYLDVQKKTSNPYIIEAFVCIDKNIFWKIGGFNEKLTVGEGTDLLKRAVRRNIKLTLLHEPKYTYSLRRLRKQGTLRSLRNAAQIELSRLINKKLTAKSARNLYPMEGGTYFEIDPKEKGRIEKLFNKVRLETENQIKNRNNSLLKYILKKLSIR